MDFLNNLFGKRQISDSSKALYIRNLIKLNDGNMIDNLKFLNKPQDISDKLSDLHYTTQRNYYNAIIVYLMSIEEDEDILKEYNDLRDDLNKKYEDEQATGTISDKQKDKWIEMNDFVETINKVQEEIKEKKNNEKERIR